MASIYDWSLTALSNSTVDGVSIAEFCAPANLNNGLRAIMANIAKFLQATTGELVSTGTADAQLLATNLGWAALEPAMLAFKAGAALTNTGAMTLNVDGLGVRSIKLTSGDPPAGAVTAGGVYIVAYDTTASVWFLVGGANLGALYQSLNTNLTEWATLNPSANAGSLVTAATYAAMRTLLDLEAGTDFYSVSAADAAFQPIAANLTEWATLNPSANAGSLVEAASYAAMRALLDLEVGTDFAAPPTTGQLPIRSVAFLRYTSGTAVANGGTTSGANLTLATGYDDAFNAGGTVQTGTWTNISGETQDDNGFFYNRGYWVRTA